MTKLAIQTQGVGKAYNDGSDALLALQNLDLSIEQGEIYALLGPNGAGKTTTISILTTLLPPTSGSATVAGFDVVDEAEQVRRRIGVTFQEMVLDQELTGRQLMDFHGQLYGLSKSVRRQRISELANMVELTDALDRKVIKYSGGMKRRLELARGLMTYPEILFLDEPTQGLDPQNRAGIWSYILRLRDEAGLTLLLTTHYMEEAETLADRVGIIDGGELIVEGEPAQLVRQMGADVITLHGTGEWGELPQRLRSEPYVTQLVEHAGDTDPGDTDHWRLQIGVDKGDQRLVRTIELAGEQGVSITDVNVSQPTLEDVFLAHTGHALRDT